MQRPADADRIRDLLVVTFTPYAHALGREPEALDWVPERIRAGDVWWCDADALAEVGVAVLDRAGTTLNLDRLAIAPEHQKSRHGTAALRAVEALGLSLGADRMTLRTAQPFTHLVAFYSRAGFEVVDLRPSASGQDTVPRIQMAKRLSRTPPSAS